MRLGHDLTDGWEKNARRRVGDPLALAWVFAGATLRYWLEVFPRTRRELRRWRRRAEQVPSPAPRRLALEALDKHGNMEGAAAFAAYVPWRYRGRVVRALVAFQAIYNHADTLAEQSNGDPVGNARGLHEALLAALDPDPSLPNHFSRQDDGGYLAEMVEACRTALLKLPSCASVAAPTRRAAERIVAFQSLSLGEKGELERWARTLLPSQSGLESWEAAAAAGSSLGVHVLIAMAAAPSLGAEDVAAIEDAYFPWIGALHSLLDSLVDQEEDAETGQLSLIGCYASPVEAATRMRWLAARAMVVARGLPRGHGEAVLVTAMACSYLSTPEASALRARGIAQSVREALGPLAGPALLVFRARHLASRIVGALRRVATVNQTPPAVRVGEGDRGADARAA